MLTVFNGEHQTNTKSLGGLQTDAGVNTQKEGGET